MGNSRRLAIAVPVAIGALALMAAPASALVIHLPDGRSAGLQLRAGVDPASVSGSKIRPGVAQPQLGQAPLADNGTVQYGGGPVLHTAAPYLVFWDPSGSGISSSSRHVLEQYLTDVAADSGLADDTLSVARQYYDATGFASVDHGFSAGSQVISDTHAFPSLDSSNCSVPGGYANCVTDTQIQTELARLIAADHLHTGIASPSPLYLVITPATTDVCMDAQDCADDGSPGSFCAYHGNFTDSSNQVVYASVPFGALLGDPKGCQSDNPVNTLVQEPNGDVADVVADDLSHELLESITDPLTDSPAWLDNTTQNEIADNCQSYGPVNETNSDGGPTNPNAYSPVLGGTATLGTLYDQSINGDRYYTQTVWSNGDVNCESHPAAGTVSAAFTPSTTTALAGTKVTFNPSASASSTGFSSTTWSFGDGGSSFAAASLSGVSHNFTSVGTHQVTLTLVDTRGNLATVTHAVRVVAAPVAVFTHTPATGSLGAAIRFDASGSHDPNTGVRLTSYKWTFDDGSSASGAIASHAFATSGTHSVTLVVTDSLGFSGRAKESIGVLAPGRITSISAKNVKGVAYVIVSVSGPGRVSFGSKTVSLSRAGSASFKLSLSAAQKRQLAHHHSVRKNVTVTYVPRSGPRVVKTQVVKIAG